MVTASLLAFVAGGHFAARAVIAGQHSHQLEELAETKRKGLPEKKKSKD